MKKLFIIPLILWTLNLYAPNLDCDLIAENMKRVEYNIKKAEWLEETLESIKFQEGLKLKPYKCPSGYATIGYGHALLKGENWNAITEEQADSILLSDFSKRFEQTDENLSYNKRLALAHFIYNVGIGTYNQSKLRKRVENSLPIDDLIIQYCYYKRNGKYVKSNHILKSRKFELKLYNYCFT